MGMRRLRRRQTLWIVLLVLYAAGIFVLSSLPIGAPGPLRGVVGIDKVIHALEYALFLTLAWLATGRRMTLSLGLTILFAGSDELHQAFAPSRTATWLDFVADAAGAAAAAVFLMTLTGGLLASMGRRILGKAPMEKEK